MQRHKQHLSAICLPLLASAIGCFGGPTAIPPLHIDAKQASQKAMELHDANGDGSLDKQELDSAPALQAALERMDANQDGALTADEIEARIDGWNEKAIGLLTAKCTVLINNRPLAGANIRLEPAPFLEGQIETAIGLTDEFGDALLTIPADKRPIPDCPPGVQVGLYRVVISKQQGDKEWVASKYNTETTLGQEVSYQDPIVSSRKVFKLRK